jgi:hypothetical protein
MRNRAKSMMPTKTLGVTGALTAAASRASGPTRGNAEYASEHDPEKCVAVFRKDHAQLKTQSAMTIQPIHRALGQR